MMKVFNYIRVSTKEQNEQRQIVAMNEFNKANGYDNAIQMIDKSSGTNTERPQLQLLLQVVGDGDLVVIKSIDRLSRNYDECRKLWQQITDKGADIIVLDMPLLEYLRFKFSHRKLNIRKMKKKDYEKGFNIEEILNFIQESFKVPTCIFSNIYYTYYKKGE